MEQMESLQRANQQHRLAEWSRRVEDEVQALTPQQYRWLMEGLKTEQPKANKAVSGLSVI